MVANGRQFVAQADRPTGSPVPKEVVEILGETSWPGVVTGLVFRDGAVGPNGRRECRGGGCIPKIMAAAFEFQGRVWVHGQSAAGHVGHLQGAENVTVQRRPAMAKREHGTA